MASILLGTAAAASVGPVHPGWLALTVLGIFALEVASIPSWRRRAPPAPGR